MYGLRRRSIQVLLLRYRDYLDIEPPQVLLLLRCSRLYLMIQRRSIKVHIYRKRDSNPDTGAQHVLPLRVWRRLSLMIQRHSLQVLLLRYRDSYLDIEPPQVLQLLRCGYFYTKTPNTSNSIQKQGLLHLNRDFEVLLLLLRCSPLNLLIQRHSIQVLLLKHCDSYTHTGTPQVLRKLSCSRLYLMIQRRSIHVLLLRYRDSYFLDYTIYIWQYRGAQYIYSYSDTGARYKYPDTGTPQVFLLLMCRGA